MAAAWVAPSSPVVGRTHGSSCCCCCCCCCWCDACMHGGRCDGLGAARGRLSGAVLLGQPDLIFRKDLLQQCVQLVRKLRRFVLAQQQQMMFSGPASDRQTAAVLPLYMNRWRRHFHGTLPLRCSQSLRPRPLNGSTRRTLLRSPRKTLPSLARQPYHPLSHGRPYQSS
jgi:hypothetical protein